MIEIIPSILAKTDEEFIYLVEKLEPYTDRVHLDIADGIFVPNKTIDGYKELLAINTGLKFDIHLMVKNPGEHIEDWLSTKADRYFVHVESDHDLRNCIDKIKDREKKVGLVINPETNTDIVKDFIGIVDYIQFMTVYPGFYGGKFVEKVVDKILKFHSEYPNIPIVADGAIHSETYKLVKDAGASILVLGSHILSEGRDIGKTLEELKNGSR